MLNNTLYFKKHLFTRSGSQCHGCQQQQKSQFQVVLGRDYGSDKRKH